MIDLEAVKKWFNADKSDIILNEEVQAEHEQALFYISDLVAEVEALREENKNLLFDCMVTEVKLKACSEKYSKVMEDNVLHKNNISKALDALNFACGSDDREIYKCACTTIKEIIDSRKDSDERY